MDRDVQDKPVPGTVVGQNKVIADALREKRQSKKGFGVVSAVRGYCSDNSRRVAGEAIHGNRKWS